jgi:catechol 1,2-dioxygenase
MNVKKFIATAADVTDIAQAAMQKTENLRLKEIMASLVEHAHAFVRDTKLTNEEFETGLNFLAHLGQANTDKHNEVVLAADVLGLSTLVTLQNSQHHEGQTASCLLGPFWRKDAPQCRNGESIARSATPGSPMYVSGRVLDIHLRPITGAMVDVWQASPTGLYENQDPNQEDMNLRGRFLTNERGEYGFITVRPAGYPVPTHGPTGRLLELQKRTPYRPAHIHFMVSAEGHKTLVSQIFADDSEHLESDVTFGVLESVIGHFERHDKPMSGMPPLPTPFYSLKYDFVLDFGVRTFPEPPIK